MGLALIGGGIWLIYCFNPELLIYLDPAGGMVINLFGASFRFSSVGNVGIFVGQSSWDLLLYGAAEAAGHSEVGTPHPAEVVSAYPQKFPSGRPRAEQPLQAARTALCCPPTSCTLGRNCSRGLCSRNPLHFFNRQHGMGVGAACAHLRGNPNRLHQLLLRGALS